MKAQYLIAFVLVAMLLSVFAAEASVYQNIRQDRFWKDVATSNKITFRMLTNDQCSLYNYAESPPVDFTVSVIPSTIFSEWKSRGLKPESYARAFYVSGPRYPPNTLLAERTGASISQHSFAPQGITFSLPPGGITTGGADICGGEFYLSFYAPGEVVTTTTTTQVVTTTTTQPIPTTTLPPVPVLAAPVRFVAGVNSGPQITVTQGTWVDVHVTLDSPSDVTGTLSVAIRKDVALSPDVDYVTLQRTVTVPGTGTMLINVGSFVANDLTIRSYFPKIYWNGQVIYDPTDPVAREHVTVTPPPTTTSSSTTSTTRPTTTSTSSPTTTIRVTTTLSPTTSSSTSTTRPTTTTLPTTTSSSTTTTVRVTTTLPVTTTTNAHPTTTLPSPTTSLPRTTTTTLAPPPPPGCQWWDLGCHLNSLFAWFKSVLRIP